MSEAIQTEAANGKVRELALRLLNEDFADALEVLDQIALGKLELFKAHPVIPAEAVEWGTDYWGEVLSEPTEEDARRVAKAGDAGVKVYTRTPLTNWMEEL